MQQVKADKVSGVAAVTREALLLLVGQTLDTRQRVKQTQKENARVASRMKSRGRSCGGGWLPLLRTTRCVVLGTSSAPGSAVELKSIC